ncbi:LuxR C-terminal-related transcriptional regulator [Agromyces sp. SYSU T00194]|uniref:LuxR C-terminal-related transcriptional regulator n=1 Tax=Agromyces chitinivorans TaxID=3158560 RepID=UPI003391D60F
MRTESEPPDATDAPAPTSAPSGERARAEQLLARARAESRTGSAARAWDAAVGAAAIGRALGDADVVARAATAVQGQLIASREATAAQQALCLEALAMLGPEPSDRRTLVADQLSAISTAWSEEVAPPEARIDADAAERRFLALQAEHARALGPHGIADRLGTAARLVELGHAAADDEILAWGWLWRADALLQLGLRVEVAEAVAALTAVVHRSDAPAWRWRLELVAANTALWEDRLAAASVLADRARELGEAAGAADAGAIQLFFRSSLALRTGEELAAVERDVAASLVGAPQPMQAWRGELLAELGRRDEAVAIWRTIAPRLDALPPTAVEWLIACQAFSRLAILADDRASAAQLRDTLAPFGHLHVVAGVTTPYGGPVALVLGRLEAFLGDAGAAGEWFAQAERRAAELGAVRYARAAADEAARISSRTSPLSPREREVAALVAEGASNRAIAADLFLSERTVEQHLRSILRKLGAPNRAAVAAWVARTGG